MSGKITAETIEPIHGKIWFCQHGEYEETSVLAGQEFRQLVACYDTVEDAVHAHPKAKVLEYEWWVEPAIVPTCAPDWFDPMDAGEVWSEEDY